MRKNLSLAAVLLAWLAGCGGHGFDETPSTPVSYAKRCGLPEAAQEPNRIDAPTGPQCIGAAEYVLTDHEREEPFTETPDDRRSLQVRVVYPTAAGAEAPRMPYGHAMMYTALGLPDGFAAAGHARTGTPLLTDQRAPVILFSPGLGTSAELYAGLTEDLASHGYVVVTINHPYISGPTPLPDGRVVAGTLEEGTEQAHAVVVADELFVLDWLAQRNADRNGPLSGKLDLSRIGAYGHSFGGAAALQLQRTEARVKAAVDLDGSLYGERDQPWTKPWMILDTVHIWEGQEIEDLSVKNMWHNRQGPAVYETLPGICHGDFSDLAWLGKTYNARHPAAPVELAPDLFCAKDPAAVQRDVRGKVLAFFRQYL